MTPVWPQLEAEDQYCWYAIVLHFMLVVLLTEYPVQRTDVFVVTSQLRGGESR